MAYRQPPTPAEIVIMVAGAVMLLFSFLDFDFRSTAWSRGLFPVATLLPIYGVVMAAHLALTRFGNVRLPRTVAGFTWEQVQLALGLMSGLMAIGWLATDLVDRRIGAWFEILGGFALLVGAIMLQRERHTGAIG